MHFFSGFGADIKFRTSGR